MSAISCGFVGLGSQGAPIAHRIVAAGFPLMLWGRRQQTLEPFRDTAATIAPDLTHLAQCCDHIGICVTDDLAVKAVCEPIIASMKPGALIAVHSTVHPRTCRALAEHASQRGVFFLDAPVSGGAPAAKVGALTLMIGGSAEALAQARPAFDTFARLIVHVGEVGTAQIAKIINNSLMAVNLALAHNALQVAASAGLNPCATGEVLKASSGHSFALEVALRRLQTGAFGHDTTLLDKIHLLGSLLGELDPTFAALRDATVPVLQAFGDTSLV